MRLATAAWLAFAAHAGASILSFLVLQHGSPVGPAPLAREAYVAEHLALWRAGWLFWTLSSISLVVILFALDRRAGWLAVAALPFDLGSQLVLALPAWRFEGLAYLGTGVIANGIYTAAFAWAVLAQLPRSLGYAALPVVLGGIGVSVASLVMHPRWLFASMALLSASMIVWLGLLGMWSWPRRSEVTT